MDTGFEGSNNIQNVNSQNDDSSTVKSHDEIRKLFQSVKAYEKRHEPYDVHPEPELVETELDESQQYFVYEQQEPALEVEPNLVDDSEYNQEFIDVDAVQEETSGEERKPRLRLSFGKKPEPEGLPSFVLVDNFEDESLNAEKTLLNKIKFPEHKTPKSATFKLRFNEEGNLENIDFKKPKERAHKESKILKKLKIDKITSKIKKKDKGEGKPSEGEEGKGGKLSKIIGPLKNISKITEKLPIPKKGKKSKEKKEEE